MHHVRGLRRATLAKIDAGLAMNALDQDRCLDILSEAGFSREEGAWHHSDHPSCSSQEGHAYPGPIRDNDPPKGMENGPRLILQDALCRGTTALFQHQTREDSVTDPIYAENTPTGLETGEIAQSRYMRGLGYLDLVGQGFDALDVVQEKSRQVSVQFALSPLPRAGFSLPRSGYRRACSAAPE